MPDVEFSLPRLSAAEALARAAAGELVFLDLRKPAAAKESGARIAGAEVRDPFAFDHSDPLMTAGHSIAVFCVHGHEVSRFGCALLRLHGRDAVFVEGGFEEMLAAGAPTIPIGAAE